MADWRAMDWDEVWRKDSSDLLSRGPSARARLRLMRGLIRTYGPEGGSFLDVGCGAGLLVREAASLGLFQRVVGADISELPLEHARTACPAGEFVVRDICAAPLAERFDLITCMMTLDLVPDDDRAAKHLAEMLAPGGHLIAVVQHLEKYRTMFDDHYRTRRHDRASLTGLLSRHGLEPVRVFAWGWPIYDLYYRLYHRATAKNDAGNVGTPSIPSRSMGIASIALSALFTVDDLFIGTNRGRVLFGVFRKPA